MQDINYIWGIVNSWCMHYGTEIIKILVLVLVGSWIINKLCRLSAVFLMRTNLDMGLVWFLSLILKFVLRAILVLLALSVLGINMTSTITAIGASLVTIGLVLKDSLSNFVSGLLLVINKPIRVGDYIEFENVKGTVTKIETIFTTLNSQEGRSIIIPNFRLVSNNIVRDSPYDVCQYSFDIFLAGSEPGMNIRKMLEILFISDQKVVQIPPPNIHYNTSDSKGADIEITLFCEKRNADELRGEIKKSVENSLNKSGIRVDVRKT